MHTNRKMTMDAEQVVRPRRRSAWRGMAVAALLGVVTIAYAQLPKPKEPDSSAMHARDSINDHDIEFLRAMFDEMSDPNEGSTCRLMYSVTTATQRFGATDTTVVDVQFVGSRTRSNVRSSSFLLRSDTTIAALVLPGDRTIVLTSTPPTESRLRQSSTIGVVRDTMFDGARIIGRSLDTLDGGLVESVTLALNDSVMARYAIRTLRIGFDRRERRLRVIRADFARGDTQFMEVRYGVRTCDSTDDAFVGRAVDGIVDSQGNATGSYAGYAVIDNRDTAIHY